MTLQRRVPLAARLFALIGLAVTLVAAVGAVAWRIADPAPIVQNTFGFGDLSLVSFGVLGATFAAVGGLLVVRRPSNAVGWLMVVIGTSYALSALAAAVTFSAIADGPPAAGVASVAAWFAVLFSTLGGLVFVLGLIFPTGRGQTPAWDRGVRGFAVLLPVLILVAFLIRPGPLQVFPSIENPFGFGPDFRPVFGPQPSVAIASSIIWLAPIVVWSIVSRYRMSDAVGRQQLRWFVASLLVAISAFVFAAITAVLTDRPPEVGLAVFGFAGALVPIAIGIAILRHGLYDINRIISRTVSYAIVTGLLGAVFVGVIIVLQTAFADALGGGGIPVAVSTLAVFALFQPVLRRVRRTVDRRFDRARYDGEQTAAEFGERLRWETHMERVTGDLRDTVEHAVAPSSLVIWLRQPGAR
ncbi:MAG: hypothetical protein ACJ77W_03320 [Chloroflexota bacterium]